MTDPSANPSGSESLRAQGRVLAAAAPYVTFGLAAIGPILGALHAIDGAKAQAPSWAVWLVTGLLALRDLVLFAILGWVAGQFLRLSAAWIDLALDRVETMRRMAEQIGRQVVPALERLADAREQPPPAPADDGRARAGAEVRHAIEEGRWGQAQRLAQVFSRDFPDAAEADQLAAEAARGRGEAIAALRARLDASREANDPDTVLALHDELGRLLDEVPRTDLDRQVIAWLMGLIQKRMWTGTVRADVVELAARAADRFGHTREGASLRASLPILRRSAGLCPRCAQPYAGIDDACPSCLAGGLPSPPPEGWGGPSAADSNGPPADQLDGGTASDRVE